jgi:outer membrane immunogenic protein
MMGNTMRKLLLGSTMLLGMAASAAAADLPLYTKAPPPVPGWSWTGFYLGVQGGAGWGTNADSVTAATFCTGANCAVSQLTPGGLLQDSYGLNGLHGGGTAGFNWQRGLVVFGVEGDISAADIKGTGDCTNSFGVVAAGGNPLRAGCQTKMTWFGTVTGRLGVTVDHALVYIKGGAAFAHFDHDVTTGTPGVPGAAGPSFSTGADRTGFTIGTGIEFAVWGNWSAKVEYDYMDFGTKNLNFLDAHVVVLPTITTSQFADVREQVHVVRAGLNYRFNWGGMPGY